MDEDAIKAQDARVKARAHKAKIELGETESAFDGLRGQAIAAIIASKPGETEKREQIYHAIKTIDTVRDALKRIVLAGEQVDLIAEITARPDSDQG